MNSNQLRKKSKSWLILLCVSWITVQYSSTSGIHSLNDQMVQNHFFLCPLNDVLLHCSFGDQSINIHLWRERIDIIFLLHDSLNTSTVCKATSLTHGLPVSSGQSCGPWLVPAGRFEDSSPSQRWLQCLLRPSWSLNLQLWWTTGSRSPRKQMTLLIQPINNTSTHNPDLMNKRY